MAKNNKKPKITGVNPMDTLVKKMLTTMDPNQSTEENLSKRGIIFKDIINDELELSKGISQGSIIDFSKSLTDYSDRPTESLQDSTDNVLKYINSNANNIYQFFNDKYRNKYIEARDLKFISKFTPALGQTVRLALTHIVSSDDLSGQVTRNLHLGKALSENDESNLMSAIEQFENETKLLMKLKNIVYKNTLITGRYFVYAISYHKLFCNYEKSLQEQRANTVGEVKKTNHPRVKGQAKSYASESVTTIALEGADATDIRKLLADDMPNNSANGKPNIIGNIKEKDEFISNIATVECVRSGIPVFVSEDISDINQLKNSKHFTSAMEASSKNLNKASDATFNTDGKDDSKFNVSGTYIKFIPANSIVPVEVLGEVIGYFYVDSKLVNKAKPALSMMNGNISNAKKQSAIEKISDMLSERVAEEFSDKFVATNIQFKKLIADCIMVNGATNTEYKIQFIPREDIIEFKINEDEDGHGTSILADSMFPAKILAAVTMRKSLNYINKSGDKTILHVKGGNADISRKNQAMRIARNLQEQNVTAADVFGDSNIVFQKYSADGNILMPSSRSGSRLVEFERMDGQQIDTNVEWEKDLSNQSIIGTGVNPLMIEQYNQADFAKAFTTAHVGFAGIVAGWQCDLEDPTTELYKRIITNLDIEDGVKQKVLPVFRFSLPRPQTAAVQTMSDVVNAASSFVEVMATLKYGEVTDDDEKKTIQQVKAAWIREWCPSIPWNRFDDIAKEVYMREKGVKDESPKDDTSSGGADFDADF